MIKNIFPLMLCCWTTLVVSAESLLADAVQQKNWAQATALLTDKKLMQVVQEDGTTALHWAVHYGNYDMVKLLLAAGADANAQNNYQVSPLSLACTNGHANIVHALLTAGAHANGELNGGVTNLMTAARTGNPDVVAALIKQGAKVLEKDSNQQTALMWAAAEGHATVVKQLIEAGAPVNEPLKSGLTPLLFAAREGHIDVVRVLLASKADVNHVTKDGPTKKGKTRSALKGSSALIFAIENGHFELAMLLIQAGADPNDQRTGYTPLHTMVWVRKPHSGDDDGQPAPDGSGKLTSIEFIRKLIAAGANIHAQLKEGVNGSGKLSFVGATPLFLAAKHADLEYIKVLVELGADPLAPNATGTQPLMAAAGLGCLAALEEAGTETECIDTVAYLLTVGSNIDATDKNGETAMHGAAYKSLPKMVQFLSDKGALVSAWDHKNKFGWTPLLIAEGFRPGNYKPHTETIDAIHKVMIAQGVTPPPPTPRPDFKKSKKGYVDPNQ